MTTTATPAFPSTYDGNTAVTDALSMSYNILGDRIFIQKATDGMCDSTASRWLRKHPHVERDRWLTFKSSSQIAVGQVTATRYDIVEMVKQKALRELPDIGLNASVQIESPLPLDSTTGALMQNVLNYINVRIEEEVFVGTDGTIKTRAGGSTYQLDNITWHNSNATTYVSNSAYYGQNTFLDPMTHHRLQHNAPDFLMGSRRSLMVLPGPEEKARALLRSMIGDGAFRRYLKDGFVSYKAKSGKVYQIPGQGMVTVWNHGKAEQKLCLVFQKSDMPPTDSVIMRLLILEHDEAEFIRLAKTWSAGSPERFKKCEVKPGRFLAALDAKKQGKILVA